MASENSTQAQVISCSLGIHILKQCTEQLWKAYSTTVFMESHINDVVSLEAWLAWNGSLFLDTLYNTEYKNYGPGARVPNRVKWSNYYVLNNSNQPKSLPWPK